MFSLTYVSNSRNKVNTLSLREKNSQKGNDSQQSYSTLRISPTNRSD